MKSNKIIFFNNSVLKALLFCAINILFFFNGQSQNGIYWTNDDSSYFRIEKNEIVRYDMPLRERKVLISKEQLTLSGSSDPLVIEYFSFSSDQNNVLLFTNTSRVWRLNSKGDYWILNMKTGTLNQLGKTVYSEKLFNNTTGHFSLNLQNLQSGVYSVSLLEEGKMSTEKIIIQ